MSELDDEVRDPSSSRVTPWPADEPWRGAVCEVTGYLGERISVAQSVGYAELPRQMAMLWQQRNDLRRAYDLTQPHSYDKYIAWCLTTGIEEGQIAPELIDAAFWEELDQPVHRIDEYDDMPVSRALVLLHAARNLDKPMEAVAEDDPLIWLELALWSLLTASSKYRWSAAMTKSLRAHAYGPVPSLTVHGVPLPRLLLMLRDGRADLHANFDLSLEEGRSALLCWFLFAGLEEYGISPGELPEYFIRRLWDAAGNDGLPVAHRLILSRRPDLITRFDIGTEAGRSAYLAWFNEHGSKEFACARLSMRSAKPAGSASAKRADSFSTPPPVILTGRVADPSGRGEDIRMTMRALDARRIPFATLDRDDGIVRDPAGRVIDPDIVAQATINILHLNADSAFADYQFLRRYGIGNARLIGYWAWELAKFPTEFLGAFSFVDEIWAATHFARDAFDVGYRPVKLMPMTVELPADLPAVSRSYFRLPMFRYLFLFNFDFKSYVMRKNPEAVIAAFRHAFARPEERVALVIKTINAEAHPEDWLKLQNLVGSDRRIILRNCQYTREAMSQFISVCDCYVSLHRSEGFGRGPAEAMLLGKPVIATNYSGNTDFMNADNSFPVDYRLVPVVEGQYPGARGQVWAEPDIVHAAAQMRNVYEDPERARQIGMRARQFMQARYGVMEIGRRYVERLGELEPRLAGTTGHPITFSEPGIRG